MMSVWTRRGDSASKKRTENPRGFAFGSVSGIWGIPVELEKRARMGVDGLFRCGAVDKDLASSEGVKVPFSSIPLAWAIRKQTLIRQSYDDDNGLVLVLTWAEPWLGAEDLVERFDDLMACLYDTLV